MRKRAIKDLRCTTPLLCGINERKSNQASTCDTKKNPWVAAPLRNELRTLLKQKGGRPHANEVCPLIEVPRYPMLSRRAATFSSKKEINPKSGDWSPPPSKKKIAKSILAGFTCQERISVNIEEPGLLLTSRFPERIMRLTDLNVYESCIYQHRPPAFARKAAGDSGGPKIDIAYRTLRHRLTIGDIAELQSSTGTQNPP